MADDRRPGGIGLLGFLFLVLAPIGVSAWFLSRPAADPIKSTLVIEDLDIICNGRVDADGFVVSLQLPQPGKVVRVSAAEGATLAIGDEILAIDSAPYELVVREAKAGVAGSLVEVDIAQQRLRQYPKQLEVKEKLIAAMTAEVDAAQHKVAIVKTQQSVASAVSTADVEIAEAAYRKLKNLRDVEITNLEEMRKADAKLELRAAQAKHEMAKVHQEQAEQAVRDCVLRAPSAGTILRLQAAVGGIFAMAPATVTPMAAGSSAGSVVFAPATPRIVRAELEQAYLGQVKAGMRAELRDDTRPDSPTWKGKVKSIAGWVAQRRSILFEPGEINDVRTTEVIIEFEANSEPVWIGQRMQVRLFRASKSGSGG
ncbi:MAG: HlyD family secretion protein [Gemmataceae bacterium]